MTSARDQIAEALHDALGPFVERDGAVEAVLDALAVLPRTLREFAANPQPPARWTSGEDPARWLRGACSSGDPLHAALMRVLDELALLRTAAGQGGEYREDRTVAWLTREVEQLGAAAMDAEHERLNREHPRVWRDGDDIPADTWVLGRNGYVDRIIPEGREGGIGLAGPVVEVVLPDYAAEVARDAAERAEARR